MADFRACITEALAKGEIDADAAEVATDAYDDAFASASETFGPVDADRIAAERTLAKLEAEAIEARRRRQLTIRTRRAVLETVAGLKSRRGYEGVRVLGGGGGKPPKGGWVQGGTPPEAGKPYAKGAMAAEALERLIENKPGLSGAPGPSVEGRYRVVRGGFDAQMASLIEKFETRTGLDRPGRADLRNIVKEAFGEDSGDAAAKGLAEAWSETAETARHQFNAAGGAIGKIERWGLPQVHDPVRVRDAGREAWVASILPRLDVRQMTDRATGQPFTPRRLEAVLGEVHDTIVTGGANRRAPGGRMGKGMLAKQRAEARFLVFRSSDDWMAYQTEFGEGDPFQAMMGHLDDMARDIAQMQILGPNPREQFRWLADFAQREAQLEEAGGAMGAVDRAKGRIATAERMLDHFTGDASVPTNRPLAAVGSTTRAGLTGMFLGSAVLGEIGSGAVLGAYARAFSGLSRKGDMSELVRLMALPSERAIARRTGFVIEQATDGFVRASHDNLRLMTVGEKAEGGVNAFGRRLPAAVMRFQGLTGLVAARKRALRFEIMGRLHDLKGQTLAEIKGGDAADQAFGRWLVARGFTEADWTIIRSAPVFEPRPGATFLLPRDVAQPELAARLGEAIDMETRLATPETTLWTRAKFTRDQPGTIWGELTRSTAMFKGFSATLTHLYAEEMALQAMARGGGKGSALLATAGMAAGALTFLTIGGAVSIQLREMLKGNDPKPIDDTRFWGAALAQGGGLGIAGDFLYAAKARNGKTSLLTSFGPVGQGVSDGFEATVGNAIEISAEMTDRTDPASFGEAVDKAKVGRDASNIVRRYNPLASLWWSRAAYDRAVADNVQRALDPDAQAAFDRRRKRMERETGQGQWWEQGEAAPERGPDLAGLTAAEAD